MISQWPLIGCRPSVVVSLSWCLSRCSAATTGTQPEMAPSGRADQPGDGLADEHGRAADGAHAAAPGLADTDGQRQAVGCRHGCGHSPRTAAIPARVPAAAVMVEQVVPGPGAVREQGGVRVLAEAPAADDGACPVD